MRAALPVDDREAVARDAFLERVGLEVETAEAGYGRGEISVISSWAHTIREAFDLMPTDTEQGWDNIAARLAGIPDALAGYRTTLAGEADARARGRKRQYAEIAGQVRRWTGQEGPSGDFFADLVAEAPEARRDELAGRAGAASAAYAELGAGSRPSSRRAAATARPRGGSGTRWPRASSSARPWTSRRPTRGAGRS